MAPYVEGVGPEERVMKEDPSQVDGPGDWSREVGLFGSTSRSLAVFDLVDEMFGLWSIRPQRG